jgi:CheY-like chemotaxis protein
VTAVRSGATSDSSAAGPGPGSDQVGQPLALPPILVAEDNEDARAVFVRLVGKLRIANPIEFAEDGQVAIEYLAGVVAGQRVAPVVILLDLNMPRKSGLDVLRWIRDQGALPATPIVILTGSAEMHEVSECHTLGVASYLVKPVGFGALSDVLRGLDLRWALLSMS